jgi:SAM-dependent methyltransferase
MSEKHYFEQIRHTEEYLIPYFDKNIGNIKNLRILEIGCAEGGSLEVFRKLGCKVCGIELEQSRVDIAKQKNPDLDVRQGNILDGAIKNTFTEKFDLIILRDVIEHIPDRKTTLKNVKLLLKDDGWLYITFPPLYSPFAGHQQNSKTIFGKTPWLHLLPNSIIKLYGRKCKVNPVLIDHVIENSNIGLTIRAFEKYLCRYKFKTVVKDLFLIRPVFKIRFGLKPKKFPNIPIIREFGALGCEYLSQKR